MAGSQKLGRRACGVLVVATLIGGCMAGSHKPGSLDFLSADPAPVTAADAAAAAAAAAGDGDGDGDGDGGPRLADSQVQALMKLRGVDGVWIERESSGEAVVVIHYTPRDHPNHLPQTVNGLRVRIVGGEPVRAW